MTHQDIRSRFIDFFKQRGHTLVPAAPLVPSNDPTVLFTVAGMQQFKDFYQHPDEAPAKRIVTIQPCIRTVDIDEVGDDSHNTVFEMLGNFSFGYTSEDISEVGPYFKKEAISWAWEFFTKELSFTPGDMRVTYFGGDSDRPADTESHDILKTMDGISFIEPTVDDNFWGPVGEEGPCGPCVEFYYKGVELGNVVLNEYYRNRDGTYVSLDYKGVDTGLGFDRIVCAIQEKNSIYETDLLAPLMHLVREKSYNYRERQGRIIVDHAKAALFLLCDGVRPGNKARDYILRRLIRRAVRAAQVTGFDSFTDLLQSITGVYGPYYESIDKNHTHAIESFELERQKFLKTLQSGINQLEKIIGQERGGEVSGEQAFKLFDTYGFPLELTKEMAEESGCTVDVTGFEELFAKHRIQSKAGMEKIFQGGLADHSPQTVAHHTAHHLLLAALRQILGDHVVQRGSNITGERLRIDVSHPEKIDNDDLKMAESLVNQKIEEDLPVLQQIMDRDEALESGALAEFGAKYPKDACIYSIIDQDGSVFSREFCGGPHVNYTGELGRFEILKEEAGGSGVRRIRARVVPR